MLGIDLIKISRIEAFYERFGDKALEKFLSPQEIANTKNTSSYAGLWAAKEAVAKALGLGISKECGFHDIKIHKNSSGAPYFTLSAHLVSRFSITQSALSITHDGDYAIAVASIQSSSQTPMPIEH